MSKPDLSRFEAARRQRARTLKCKVGQTLAGMIEQDRTDFIAALANRERYSNEAIALVFRDEGTPISVSVIRCHRMGTCPCARSGS